MPPRARSSSRSAFRAYASWRWGSRRWARDRLPRRVWRNTVCAAEPRCSPPGTVLSRAHIYGYGRSLRPPQGTSIAPRRRAVLRQTLLARGRVEMALVRAALDDLGDLGG